VEQHVPAPRSPAVVAVAEAVLDRVLAPGQRDVPPDSARALVMSTCEVLADRSRVAREEVGARVEVIDLELEPQLLVIDAVAHLAVLERLAIATLERAEAVGPSVGGGQRRGLVAPVAHPVARHDPEPQRRDPALVIGLVAEPEDPADPRPGRVPDDEHAVLPPLLVRVGPLPALRLLAVLHVSAHPSPRRPGKNDRMIKLEQMIDPTVSRVARKRLQARSRLIEAASAVIAERGVEGLRLRELADRADVGFGSFYTHFASKEELVEAV